jgi:hypothetical protein
MQTPKKGGRYKRLADGSIVPAAQAQAEPQAGAPATNPPTMDATPAVAADDAAADNPKEGD